MGAARLVIAGGVEVAMPDGAVLEGGCFLAGYEHFTVPGIHSATLTISISLTMAYFEIHLVLIT